MAKSKIGVKKDYTKMWHQMQRDLENVPRDIKLEYYRSFYRQIAKTADQRLVNLENLAKEEGYKNVLEWSYKDAMREIRGTYGSEVKRFNRKQPDDLRSVFKNIRRVLTFLEAPTSSKQGIDEIYGKRADTINTRYDTNIDWSTVGDLFNSRLYRKTDSKYGSKTVLKAIGKIQANQKEIKKYLKDYEKWQQGQGKKPEFLSLHIEGTSVERTVNNMLKYYKKDVNQLIKNLT